MANTRTLSRSFAGGEIAPELYGRLDLDKYQTGLRTCRNFIALPYGPAQRRPGTRFVNEVKDSNRKTRLLPFSFSADQTIVLEVGHQYIRFHDDGGTVLEANVAVTGIAGNTVTAPLHGYLVGQDVFIGGRFLRIATVPDANTFTVVDRTGTPVVPTGSTVARVYEIASPYAEADLFDINFVQSSDVFTMVHPSYEPRELRRLGATNWELTVITFQPLLDAPQNTVVRLTTGSGTILYRYRVTAQLQSGLEESFASRSALGPTRATIANLQSFAPSSITAITQAATGVFTTAAAHGLAVNHLVWLEGVNARGMTELVEGWYLVNSVPAATTFTLKTEDGVVLDTSTYSAYVNAAPQATVRRALQVTTTAANAFAKDDPVYFENLSVSTFLNDMLFRVGFVTSTTAFALKTESFEQVDGFPGAATITQTGLITLEGVKNNLAVSPNKNTISWSPVAGAYSYRVYKEKNGLYGFIGQALGTSFVDDNILPDMTQTPPEPVTPFNAVNNYPSAVSYFDQRRCFAATNLAPQAVYMTRPGTESNLSSSVPTREDDAITFKIAAREQNRIRHLVPLGDLLMLTAGGEWRVFTGSGDPITPQSIQARPQSYVGANNVQPQVTSVSVLYISAQGSRFRELTYSAENGAYATNDLSVLTPHFVDGFRITDSAYARGPVPILWAIRSDGTLLGMTYLPDQRVRGWHRHDTDGFFESVACVAEANEDILYTVVRRVVDGRTVRYVERLDNLRFDQQEDAFFVDSGLTYRGAPVSTITGLWHLEGKQVQILADGAVQPPRTVSGGQILLQTPASVVHVGLAYVSDLETLPLSLEGASAAGVGFLKNIPKVTLRVYRSSGVFVGRNADNLYEHKQRSVEPWGVPPAFISEEISVPIDTSWTRDGTVFVRQAQPLPLTLQSMSLEVTLGG